MDRPLISSPAEPFAVCPIESACDSPPTVRPGTKAFADFVMGNFGGGNSGFVRACGTRPSGHYTGKAWDWTNDANDPVAVMRVEDLLNWLFANDYELFKRAGICYVIWNRQRWSPRVMSWVEYTGPNPHTDHVHFSFSQDGADGQTSFYTWLNGGQPMTKPVIEQHGVRIGYLFAGATAGFLIYTYRKDINRLIDKLEPKEKWV